MRNALCETKIISKTRYGTDRLCKMETLISQLLMQNRLCSSAQAILHNSLIIRVFHFTAKKSGGAEP